MVRMRARRCCIRQRRGVNYRVHSDAPAISMLVGACKPYNVSESAKRAPSRPYFGDICLESKNSKTYRGNVCGCLYRTSCFCACFCAILQTPTLVTRLLSPAPPPAPPTRAGPALVGVARSRIGCAQPVVPVYGLYAVAGNGLRMRDGAR